MAGSEAISFMCKDYRGSTFLMQDGKQGTCEELLGLYMYKPYLDYKDMEEVMARHIIVNNEQDCLRAMDLSESRFGWENERMNICHPTTIKACAGTVSDPSYAPFASGYFLCAQAVMQNNLNYIGNRFAIDLELQLLWPLNDVDFNLFGIGLSVTGMDMLNHHGEIYSLDSLRWNVGVLGLLDTDPIKLDDKKFRECGCEPHNGGEILATLGMAYERSLVGSETGYGLVLEASAKLGVGSSQSAMAKTGFKFVCDGLFALSAGVAINYLFYGVARPENDDIFHRDQFIGLGPYFAIGPYL